MASLLKEEIERKFLECVICHDDFKNPRTLPCLHVCCSECLHRWIGGKKRFLCPICSADTEVSENGVDGFLVAFFINALKDVVRGPHNMEKPTVDCHNKNADKEHGGASVKCLECNVYYCDACNEGHKLGACSSKHESILVSNLTKEHFAKAAQKQVSFCTQHQTSPLRYYCEECQIPVCQDCCLTKHKLHETKGLDDVSDKCREEYRTVINTEFVGKQQTLESARDTIESELEKSEMANGKLIEVIESRFLEMKIELEEQKSELIKKAEGTMNVIRQDYTEQHKIVVKKLASLNSTKEVLENITNFSSNVVIIQQHKVLKQSAARVLEEATPIDLWTHKTAVINCGDPAIDMGIDVKSSKEHACLPGPVNSIAVLDDLLVASHFNGEDIHTTFYVHGNDSRKAKTLKDKLQQACPFAYRMVGMKKDGEQFVIVTEKRKHALHHILMVYVDEDRNNIIMDIPSIQPLALTIDRHNDVIFTDSTGTIGRLRENVATILYRNKEVPSANGAPYYVDVNPDGDLIVSDNIKRFVFIIHSTGKILCPTLKFGYIVPAGVCCDTESRFYVCDMSAHRILRMDRNGVFLGCAVTEKDGLLGPVEVKYSKGMLIVGQENGEIKYFKI